MVRLTVQKKHRKKPVGGDPNAPTKAEWENMKEYGSFIVRDEDGEEHTFRKGECAIILPNGRKVGETIEMHEYWVGKIRDVRAREDSDVWTHVQWYWSAQEVCTHVKSFDATLCSAYERVFSDNFDYVSTSAFDAVVPLYKLNDGDLLQPHIPWDAFYTRYTFEHRARIISVRHSPLPPIHPSTNDNPSSSSSSSPSPDQPKPGEYSCLCHVPYAPLSLEPPAHLTMTTTKGKGKEKLVSKPPKSHTLMHYCPRPTCRRFFHAACLLAAGCLDPDTGAASRKRRLLCAAPDVEGEVVLGRGSAKQQRQRQQRKNGAGAKAREEEREEPEKKRIRVGTPLEDSAPAPVSTPAPSARGRGRGRGGGRGRGRSRGRGRGRGRTTTTNPSAPPTPSPSSDSDSDSDSDAHSSDSEDSEDLELLLASLPPDLVQIAEQPIVRGAAWRAGGVSGNLGAVVRARRIVYRALGGGGGHGSSEEEGEEEEEALEGWEERVGDVKRAVVDLDGAGVGGAGSGAGVGAGEGEGGDAEEGKTKKGRGRGKKGVKRKAGGTKKSAKEAEEEGVLPFLCPQCRGAI